MTGGSAHNPPSKTRPRYGSENNHDIFVNSTLAPPDKAALQSHHWAITENNLNNVFTPPGTDAVVSAGYHQLGN
jgi:hypothetical protein